MERVGTRVGTGTGTDTDTAAEVTVTPWEEGEEERERERELPLRVAACQVPGAGCVWPGAGSERLGASVWWLGAGHRVLVCWCAGVLECWWPVDAAGAVHSEPASAAPAEQHDAPAFICFRPRF